MAETWLIRSIWASVRLAFSSGSAGMAAPVAGNPGTLAREAGEITGGGRWLRSSGDCR